MTSFDSTKEQLKKILEQVGSGELQLPDFQRDWVWDDFRIKSLLASVATAYPIGALMFYEQGNPEVRFKTRPIQGVTNGASAQPGWLILDGQQRITALYQALMGTESVQTQDARGKSLRRWYYIDINIALAEERDFEDAVISVPEDRIIRTFRADITLDVSDREKEWDRELIPIRLFFDFSGWMEWYNGYIGRDPENATARSERLTRFYEQVVKTFTEYQVPLIKMFKATPKDAVCQVFEKVNTGGVSLTVFELLTATFAADDFQLREDWGARRTRMRQHPVLTGVQSDDFVQAVSLLASRKRRSEAVAAGTDPGRAPAITCKRKDLLRLTLDDYREWADFVEEGFVKAARFLHSQHIFEARDVPYRTQLVPLSAVFVTLGHSAESAGSVAKIARWFWCGVFGELYGSATETRFARDVPELVDWVTGSGGKPSTVEESYFTVERLRTMRTRNSAAYKGVHALLMKLGARDFRTGEPINHATYFDEAIDIHHIFPRDYCARQAIDGSTVDSVVNKTPLSARTNRHVGNKAPSEYLAQLERSTGLASNDMDELLRTHFLEPSYLRTDDFGSFTAHREEALAEAIEGATGKPVQRGE